MSPWRCAWLVHLFGALALLAILGGDAYAVSQGRSMRPWMMRYVWTFAGIVVLVAVSWMVTDAAWKP